MVTPRIIPRAQHTLSRKDIDPDALKVLNRLRQFDHLAYLVGGSVRDLLLGRRPKDFDIGTSAHPYEVKRLFRNCWIIGRRFRLAHVKFGQKTIEVATFRRLVTEAELDAMAEDARLLEERRALDETGPDASGEQAVADVTPSAPKRRAGAGADRNHLIHRDNTFGTPEEDAFRRDFTVNALFYDIATFSVIDYVGGIDDLHARVIRCIGDPDVRFREDPVRMLRAIRLAAKLGFGIDEATAAPIPELAPLLREAAPARLFEECLKLFLSGYAVEGFLGLERHGLLPALLPETAAALKSNRSGALRRMLIEGLRGTDVRVANGEPVSPAFLFALLLWPAYCRALMALQAQGVQAAEAQRRAADRVTVHQLATIALPRRFSLPMQEIWLLQSRFGQRKRVPRMLAHPRFRAAFDFLVLRQFASAEHADEIAFWREAQAQSGDVLPTQFESASESIDEEGGPRKRRRRRRSGTVASE
jgi:poly(A) polymerase